MKIIKVHPKFNTLISPNKNKPIDNKINMPIKPCFFQKRNQSFLLIPFLFRCHIRQISTPKYFILTLSIFWSIKLNFNPMLPHFPVERVLNHFEITQQTDFTP